eukprot:CAMPEP_0117452450 /NCGR_PEP_ID=MMETSP0759-20121206/9622_1 /TAXON_ID=63605 /ORGANISM="Percolomonas cosmopolitus, Strain WS" /LENGTH=207 /DNA_ID=CAMNT_0005245267 /DNA_START=101 /DNA_END=721 /DNA_ORIENTATION=-
MLNLIFSVAFLFYELWTYWGVLKNEKKRDIEYQRYLNEQGEADLPTDEELDTLSEHSLIDEPFIDSNLSRDSFTHATPLLETDRKEAMHSFNTSDDVENGDNSIAGDQEQEIVFVPSSTLPKEPEPSSSDRITFRFKIPQHGVEETRSFDRLKDSIDTLFDYLDHTLVEDVGKSFVLVSNFPKRTLERDGGNTLLEYVFPGEKQMVL